MPAAYIALAPLFALVLERLETPRALSWAGGGTLLLLACRSAHGRLAFGAASRADAGAARAARAAELSAALPAFSSIVTSALSTGAVGTLGSMAASELDAWGTSWSEGVRAGTGASAAERRATHRWSSTKLLLLTGGASDSNPNSMPNSKPNSTADGSASPSDAVFAAARALAAPSYTLELSPALESTEPGLSVESIERMLVSATRAQQPALLILRNTEGCVTDACFQVLSAIERFVEHTLGQRVVTQFGEVDASLAAVLIEVRVLSRWECDALVEAYREGALALLAAMRQQVERAWPRERFSAATNVAKRALINRIGSDVAPLCSDL